MTKSTITREQAQKIIVAADEVITALAGTNEDVHPDDSKKMCELWDDLNDRYAPPVVVRELARMALAAMDNETVGNEFIPKNLDKALGVVGMALPESKEEFNFQIERWIQRLIDRVIRYADEFQEQPAPELAAIVERLNLSGYEHEGGEVTPQNAAAVVDTLLQQLDDAVQGRNAQPAPVTQPVMFIDGDISSEDADKLAKVIREFNEEDERPLAKMARIIRENPHPTNECDMPKSQPAPVATSEEHRQLRDLVMMVKTLCRTVRKYNPESQQAANFTAYLQKEGLISAADCLRYSDSEVRP
jgi:hypothetical protein|nr:hypothetical protein [Klebsiella aerogenes]DAT30157.1 MAG TPA: hypothetical protein [Caudoviricetes sp.]